MEEIILLLAEFGQLPRTTSNLILNRRLRAKLPVRSADDAITAANLAEVRQLARFPRGRVCAIAVQRNDAELLAEARRLGYPYCGALKLAAKLGRVELLRTMLADATYNSTQLLTAAARCGQLEILELLYQTCDLVPALNEYYQKPIHAAASHSLRTLEFLSTLINFDVLQVIGVCGFAGNLEVLQWLRARGAHWSALACANAARLGDLAMLQWARENDCPWNELCTTAAAKHGHFELLRWARSAGCPWSARALAQAALNGHVEIVNWLFDSGAPCDAHVTIGAARQSLQMLQLCVARGAPLAQEQYLFFEYQRHSPTSAAAFRGCQATLDWLEERSQLELKDVAFFATLEGHFELAKRYIERGSKMPDLETAALSSGRRLDFIEYLYQRKAEVCAGDFYSFVISRHDIELLEWAGKHHILLPADEDFGIEPDPELQAVLDRIRAEQT
jgi:hypothetical protein